MLGLSLASCGQSTFNHLGYADLNRHGEAKRAIYLREKSLSYLHVIIPLHHAHMKDILIDLSGLGDKEQHSKYKNMIK